MANTFEQREEAPSHSALGAAARAVGSLAGNSGERGIHRPYATRGGGFHIVRVNAPTAESAHRKLESLPPVIVTRAGKARAASTDSAISRPTSRGQARWVTTGLW